MISCLTLGFNGRLGNQLFQIASTIGTARKTGYEVYFPAENFMINPNLPHSYQGCKVMEGFNFNRDLLMRSEDLSGSIKYRFSEGDNFKYITSINSIGDFTDLHGYFQNEKYFLDSRDEILDLFTFRKEIINLGDSNWNIESDSVSLHVRRGDYIQSPDHHPTQDIEYYTKALEMVGARNVYVFSDDIKWCSENLGFNGYKWNYLNIEDPYVSMYLMTKCGNNIICNSSFSWWGAWLNPMSDKKIIAPLKWFGPLINKDTSGICPPSWIRI
jgi:hypothetical protein